MIGKDQAGGLVLRHFEDRSEAGAEPLPAAEDGGTRLHHRP